MTALHPIAPVGPWTQHAACGDRNTELFFPEGSRNDVAYQTGAAKAICATCPVKPNCLQWALENGEEHGVWGGLDEAERRRYLRPSRRPKAPGGGRQRAECGTPAAYERHRRNGEPIDTACWNNRRRPRNTTKKEAA